MKKTNSCFKGCVLTNTSQLNYSVLKAMGGLKAGIYFFFNPFIIMFLEIKTKN